MLVIAQVKKYFMAFNISYYKRYLKKSKTITAQFCQFDNYTIQLHEKIK